MPPALRSSAPSTWCDHYLPESSCPTPIPALRTQTSWQHLRPAQTSCPPRISSPSHTSSASSYLSEALQTTSTAIALTPTTLATIAQKHLGLPGGSRRQRLALVCALSTHTHTYQELKLSHVVPLLLPHPSCPTPHHLHRQCCTGTFDAYSDHLLSSRSAFKHFDCPRTRRYNVTTRLLSNDLCMAARHPIFRVLSLLRPPCSRSDIEALGTSAGHNFLHVMILRWLTVTRLHSATTYPLPSLTQAAVEKRRHHAPFFSSADSGSRH